MLKWIFGIVVVLGAVGAAAAWWFTRPLIVRHPDFGTDCRQLVEQSRVEAQVDCVRVWYGTSRDIITADNTLASDGTDVVEATGESGNKLSLGRADIWLPKLVEEGGTRERGQTPHVQGAAPSEPDKLAQYVFLTRITTNGRETFTATLQDAVHYDGSDAVLLFVHGFNTKFDDALIRTAQLATDLSRERTYDVGIPVLFSWPSAGSISLDTYNGDRDRSLAAAPYLEEFLDLLTEDLDVGRINIIAHSMGNRVLTKALEDYARDYLERHNRDDLEFRILLVAADVERDVFAAANGVFDNLDANVTIYASDTDRALHVSNIVNQKMRLGDTDKDKPYIRPDPRYQTIDATAVTTELFGIGHNYYSDNPTILWDMMCTIGETRPEERALEVARYAGLPDGDPYYRVNTNIEPNTKACTLHRSAFPIGAGASAAPSERSLEPAAPAPAPSTRTLPAPAAPKATPPPPPPPPPAEEPIFEPQAAPNEIILYVRDIDTFDVTEYEAMLRPILESGREIELMLIRGHTDRVGDRQENLMRAARLAEAVRDWFALNGVDVTLIQTISMGEERPTVATEDEVDEPLNRRVEIEIRYAD